MDAKVNRIAVSVAFKKYLLGCDVDSRNVVLLTCIDSLNETNKEEKKCIDWLRNIIEINSTSEKERKGKIRKDGRWDELHYELSSCFRFLETMRLFIIV